MKKIIEFSDIELHSRTVTAAENEKSATLILLEHLAEIDRRRVYAVLGYHSLWEYVHKALAYSESQSSERVSAMRLMVKIPEVKNALVNGGLSLTTASRLASHVKREICSKEETIDLLSAIKGKSLREAERILCAEAESAGKPDLVQAVSQSTTRITIEVDHDFILLLERAKELGGHVGSSPQEIFKMSLEKFVKSKEIKSDNKSSLHAKKVLLTPISKNNKEGEKRSRYISAEIKNKIRLRSGDRCEYIDQVHHRRCEARHELEFDHIQPFAAEGSNELGNLRHYCAAHNRLAAIEFYSLKKMQEYLDSA